MAASSRFNLSMLRSLGKHAPSVSTSTENWLGPIQLSRRGFLGISSAATVGIAIPQFLRGDDFSVVCEGNRLDILVHDDPRWTIDGKMFGTRASVDLIKKDGYIKLLLKDATFPGTSLPASFESILFKDGDSWLIKMCMDCGVHVEAPLLPWLGSKVPAQGQWRAVRLRPFDGFQLSFHEVPTVRFMRDWVFEVSGAATANTHRLDYDRDRASSEGALLLELEGLPRRLECESIEWRVCASGKLGAQAQEAPATVFRFTRGTSPWRIPLRREHRDGWKLDHDDGLELFDELTVEAGSAAGGTLQSALLTGSRSDDAPLRLLPAADLRTIDGEPFHIALTRPRMVFSLGEPELKSVLLADALGEETWAHADTVSFRFGATGQSNSFMLQSAGETSTVITAPSLTALHVPAPDTNIRLTFKDGKAPFFQWSHFVQPFERAVGFLGTPPWERPLAFDLTCGDVLTVVRPADMLKLEFEFQDMVLHTGFCPRIKPANGSGGRENPSAPGVGDNDLPSGSLPTPALHCKPQGTPRVTVTFPPQHIQEKAFFHNDDAFSANIKQAGLGNVEINRLNGQPESHTPTQSEIETANRRANELVEANGSDKLDEIKPPQTAGESHLVFDLTDVRSIPFRLEDLLNWQSWKLVVDPVANTQALPVSPGVAIDNAKNPPLPGHAPAKNEATAIELPYRLFLSPSEKGQWAHSAKPVSYGNNVELWHTRLAVATKGAPDEHNATDRIVRAIFTPDRLLDRKLQSHNSGEPLDARDRAELVYLTSDYQNQAIFKACPSQPHSTPYTPLPVSVEHLILTSQGGYLKSIGNWNPPLLTSQDVLTVEQWRHVATVGRDQYVRVVYKGYLAPFAHRASLVKVSERVIVQASGTGVPAKKNWFALLHERMYIVIHEPRRDFPLFSQPNAGRDFPFRRVDVLTTVTPDLDDPATKVVSGPPQSQSLFWPSVNKEPYLFRFRLWDVEGNVSESSMPVVFGDARQAQTQKGVTDLVTLYNGGKNSTPVSQNVTAARKDPWTSIAFSGQNVAFAPSSQPGDTRYEASTLLWQIQNQSNGDPSHDLCFYERDLPLFAPQIAQANVSSTAINRVTGTTSGTWVKFFVPYVTNGFGPQTNPGEVILQVDEATGPRLQFGNANKTDQSGGFTSPDTKVVGFSRKSGPVGGTSTSASLTTWSSGKFDPPDFFGAFSTAKILGAVKLSDIIAPLLGGIGSNLEKAPQMLQQSLYEIEKPLTDFESGAVTAIRNFQDALPTRAGGNPLTRRLAPQAQAVYTSQAALETMQSNSPDLFTEAVALPYHAKLIRSIIDYAEALDAAVNDPAALASGLVDDAMAELEPAIAVVQAEVESAIETFAAQLVTALAGPVEAATDKFLLPLAQKLVSLSVKDPLLLLGEDVRPAQVAMQDLVPELLAVESMLPIARRLQGNVQQLSTKLHNGTATPADLATVVQQTRDICQDLQQLLQAAGPLGVAAQLDETTWASLQKALLEIQTKLLTLWDQAQGALALKDQLSDLERACMVLAHEMTVATTNQLNADGAQLMQNLRQLERTAAMIDGCRTAWSSLQNANAQTNASKLRYLQRLQQLQRQAIDSIRAIQRIAADLLNAAGNATVTAVLAASSLLADIWLGSDLLVEEVTCIKGLQAQVVGDLLKDAQGGVTLKTFQPIVSDQLDSLLASVKTAQTDTGNHAKNVSGNQAAVAKAHANLQAAIQSGAAADIAAKKGALLTAWQPAITEANAYLDSATAVYDQVIQYIHCAQLVVSWWVYTGYPELQEFASRENLKDLAFGFAGDACKTRLPGQNTSICGLAVSTLNNVLTSSQKLASTLAQAPPPLPVLFSGTTNSIGGISPLAPDATPSQILKQANAMVTTYSQCVVDVRKRIASTLKDAELLLQARNLVPFLLANLPIPHALSLNYDWHPQIKSFEPVFLLDSGADLKISVSSRVDLTGSKPPTYDIAATLTKFAINLIGTPSFVIVRVNSLKFTSSNGNKPDIRLQIEKVEFGKDLSFVQALAETLNPQTGPFMEFVGSGIRAGFRFHLPDVPMGGFLLMQLAIEVAVSLSFDGSPVRCQFGLSDQQNPFLLAAGIYGGGGFLQLQLGLDGVQALEGALEFGLVAGISIGPLKGTGYVVAGIYMRIAKSDSVVAGFVHAHGHMDIFGIVSMDVDLMVTVRYENHQVSGSAVFSVSVHILFFSADFTMQASYGFQGSGSDAGQASLATIDNNQVAQEHCGPLDTWMSDEAWTEYYEAFAA